MDSVQKIIEWFVAGIVAVIMGYVLLQVIKALYGGSWSTTEMGIGILISLILLLVSLLWNMNVNLTEKLSTIDKNITLGFEKITNELKKK